MEKLSVKVNCATLTANLIESEFFILYQTAIGGWVQGIAQSFALKHSIH